MTAVGREHPRPLVGDWRARAACRGRSDVFFPAEGRPGQAARDVCAGCPVLEECREWAIVNVSDVDVVAGSVFAGVSARTIKRWRLQRKGAAGLPAVNHGTYGGYFAHRRRGESPCEACREAYNAYKRANRPSRRAVAS